MPKKELRCGQALSMQWGLHALQKLKEDIDKGEGVATKALLGEQAKAVNGGDGLDTLALGITQLLNMNLPFALELALKAIIEKEDKVEKREGHLLSKLYAKITGRIQTRIDQEYNALIFPKIEPIRELFELYSKDFVEWRYLDNPEKLEKIRTTDMQLALCAILTVYDEI